MITRKGITRNMRSSSTGDILTSSNETARVSSNMTSSIQPLCSDILAKQNMTVKELQSIVKKINSNVNNLISLQPSLDFKELLDKNNETISANNNFMSTLESKWNQFTSDVSAQISEIRKIVDENQRNIVDLKSRISTLESTTSPPQFVDRVQKLEDTAENTLRSQRRNDVIVSNLMNFRRADISSVQLVQRIGSVLNVIIEPEDIVFAKIINADRTPAVNDNNTSVTHYTDVLVRFQLLSTKIRLMKSYFIRKDLNNADLELCLARNRVYLNDNLTPCNSNIFREAKKLFRIQHNNPNNTKLIKSIYISKGLIFIKDLQDIDHLIKSVDHLKKYHQNLVQPQQSNI